MSRHSERRDAVEILYAADLRAVGGSQVLDERQADEPVGEYSARLVRSVDAQRERIDSILTAKATGWPVARMSPVDRNVLRVAVVELLGDEVPAAVAIDEAVELAKHFSGEEAGRFVNGVLSGVLSDRQASERSSGS